MKTTLILTVLFFLNTSTLIAVSVLKLLKGVNIWVLVFIEVILVVGYCIYRIVSNDNKRAKYNLHHLDIFKIRKRSA